MSEYALFPSGLLLSEPRDPSSRYMLIEYSELAVGSDRKERRVYVLDLHVDDAQATKRASLWDAWTRDKFLLGVEHFPSFYIPLLFSFFRPLAYSLSSSCLWRVSLCPWYIFILTAPARGEKPSLPGRFSVIWYTENAATLRSRHKLKIRTRIATKME